VGLLKGSETPPLLLLAPAGLQIEASDMRLTVESPAGTPSVSDSDASEFERLTSVAEVVVPYPIELMCDITTGDGTRLHLRPIRPDDAQNLIEFHESLSPESIYLRYFFGHSKLSALEVERFTCVDYVDRLALVVEDAVHIVAVCRYERVPETSEAEIAFVVADNYQHQGIGGLLLERLVEAARPRGITRFLAYTLMENRIMQQMFADSGFRLTTTRDDEVVTVRFPIEPESNYRTSRKAHFARMQGRLQVTETPTVVEPS
jgi:GNAT superfamily N-acetyltransferase